MPTVEIVNATPLELQLRRYQSPILVQYFNEQIGFHDNWPGWANSEVVAELEPFRDPTGVDCSAGEQLWLSTNAGRSTVASFSTEPEVQRRVITPPVIGYGSTFQLPSDAGSWLLVAAASIGLPLGTVTTDFGVRGYVAVPPHIDPALSLLTVQSVTVCNSTDIYVELSFIDGHTRLETPCGVTLAPGGAHTVAGGAVMAASGWLARANFTGELLAMFVPTLDAQQTFTITDAFSKRFAKQFPIPSPQPPINEVALVGDARPRPRHRDHIVTSERKNPEREMFNTRPEVETRSLRISGPELIWDPVRDNEYALLRFAGENVLDLESLDMYADRVVVATPLRFPGTNVTIHARELVFEGDGQIDTTPKDFTTAARAKYHLDDRVTPADKKGKPTYAPANGANGQPAGDIGLFVGTLTLPSEGATQKRFIAHGAKGQTAEPGGRKPYAPAAEDQPAATKGKARAGVTGDAIKNRIWDLMPIAKTTSDWRWPDGADGPGSIMWQGQKLFPESGGHVVDLQLVLHDDTLYIRDTNWVVFPAPEGGHDRDHELSVIPNAPRKNADGSVSIWGGYKTAPSWKALSPGKGEDAYRGGTPGDGGRGGSIRTSLSLELVTPLCDTAGGAPGDPTPASDGGPQGGPLPAYRVIMDVVKKTPPFESDRSPQLSVEDVSAQPGASFPVQYGAAGETPAPQAVDESWLRAEVAEAVLAFARDAYRNGHRNLARRVIEPYYAALRSGVDLAELEAAFVSIEAMRGNMLDNLDYYGNPPGWVPRLRASTNMDIFLQARKIAAKLLYYGQTAEKKYASLENADDLVKHSADALGEELDFSTSRLKSAYTDLAVAYVELQEGRDKLQATQVNVDFLKTIAQQSAQSIAERQRLFKGITKLVGGVLQAMPVGQPYIGLAGSGVSTIADINFTDPDNIPKEIGKALGKFGTTTTTFLKENADLLVDDRVADLRDKLNLDKSQVADLEVQLARTKGANAHLASEVKQKSEKWEQSWKSERTTQLEALQAMRTRTQNRITALEADSAELTDEEKDLLKANKAFLEGLPDTAPSSLFKQRRLLDLKIAQLEEAIGDEERVAQTVLSAARKTEVKADAEQLKAFKTQIDSIQADQTVAKKLVQQGSGELERQKTEWNKTFKRLRGIGKGVSGIGDGIAVIGTPLSKDDPDVKALTRKLLASPENAAYQALMRQLNELGAANRAALSKCADAQNQINREVASISQNLSAQTALSRTRQSIEGALDVQTIQYLRVMQERARDMLRWSLYNLIMAWRYEFLGDVSSNLFNLDKVTAKLEALSSVDAAGKVRTLKQEDIATIEQVVVDDLLWDEWKRIVGERQRRAITRQKNRAVCQLTDEQLTQLHQTGELQFNLIRDFRVGNFNWVDARIQDFSLEDFEVESNDPNLNIRIVFIHSGESILLGSDTKSRQDKYYYFQAGAGDDAIQWGFSYAHNEKWRFFDAKKGKNAGGGTSEGDDEEWTRENAKELIKADEPDPELEDLLNKVINPSGDKGKIKYREYLPAYFSDITLRLTRDGTWDPADIDKLSRVAFRVNYALATER